MKNNFIASILIFTITSQAHAWSFNIGSYEAKGDDPQVIKDVVEGTKNVATQASNGVRDVFAVVGNASGISDVIDSNVETLVNAGRAYACNATLCYSEIVRRKQIDEAAAEAKKQYEEAAAEYERMSTQDYTDQRYDAAKKAYEAAQKRFDLVREKWEINKAEFDALNSIQNITRAENQYRIKLKDAGVQGRPLQNREMIGPAEEFAKNIPQGYVPAMQKLNEQMNVIATQTGRSKEKLLAEFLRVINFKTMLAIITETNAIVSDLLEQKKILTEQWHEAQRQLKRAQNDFDIERS